MITLSAKLELAGVELPTQPNFRLCVWERNTQMAAASVSCIDSAVRKSSRTSRIQKWSTFGGMRVVLLLLTSALMVSWMAICVGARNRAAEPRAAAHLYAKYCTSCHGRDGQAKTRKAKSNHARNLADPRWQEDVSDERIFNSIMNGRKVAGKMPGFSKKISEQEAESLVTYVRAFRR